MIADLSEEINIGKLMDKLADYLGVDAYKLEKALQKLAAEEE